MKTFRPKSKISMSTTITPPKISRKLANQLEQMILLQKKCQSNGEYIEAQTYKRRANKINQSLEQNSLSALQKSHAKSILSVQQTYKQQLHQFNEKWNESQSQFKKQIESATAQMKTRHQNQITYHKNTHKFNPTPKMLELKKMQQELAKQQNYNQANKIQSLLKKVTKQAIQKHQLQNKMRNKEGVIILKKKQQQQRMAFNQRASLEWEQNKRKKQQMLDQMMLRYTNTIKEMQFAQTQEQSKHHKNFHLWKNCSSLISN